jgi:zinc finger protein
MDEPDLTCPACSRGKMERGMDELEIPHFGRVIHYYMRCANCGYRINDFSFEGDFPKEDKIVINGKEDMDIKIVRGSSATVLIPELGLELYPGPLSESFITNVEGLLTRFLDLMPLFNDPERSKEIEERISDAMEGRISFSISISDPSGVSHFIRTG